jgi:hypothetical protein
MKTYALRLNRGIEVAMQKRHAQTIASISSKLIWGDFASPDRETTFSYEPTGLGGSHLHAEARKDYGIGWDSDVYVIGQNPRPEIRAVKSTFQAREGGGIIPHNTYAFNMPEITGPHVFDLDLSNVVKIMRLALISSGFETRTIPVPPNPEYPPLVLVRPPEVD